MTTSTLTRYATEAEMLKLFADLAGAGGGMMFHVRDARRQRVTGLTDVLLILPPVIGFFELKTMRDSLRPDQGDLLQLLTRCDRIESGIVRPVPKQESEMTMDEAVWRIVRHRPDLEMR